jgi:hypothetical protein
MTGKIRKFNSLIESFVVFENLLVAYALPSHQQHKCSGVYDCPGELRRQKSSNTQVRRCKNISDPIFARDSVL